MWSKENGNGRRRQRTVRLPAEYVAEHTHLAYAASAYGVQGATVPGSLPGKPLADGTPGPSLYCAVIVKTVDAQTRSKTGINELLRD